MLPVKSFAARRCAPLWKALRAFSGICKSWSETVAADESFAFAVLMLFGCARLATGPSRHTKQHDAMRREVISAPLLGAPDSPENHGDPKVGFILRRNFCDCKSFFQV